VTCGPVQDSTYYVDPAAGIDVLSSTGAANCPFRSLTHTLSVIGSDAGSGATVEIVNDGFSPVLDPSTGEVFPISPPANVTIVAADTTKNLPTLRLTASQSASDSGGPDYVTGFLLANPGDNLSHLVVDGHLLPPTVISSGIVVLGQTGGIDHVTVENVAGRGIDVEDDILTHGFVSLGPGVVSQNNGSASFFLTGPP